MPEKVDGVPKMVVNDRRTTVRHIAETDSISTESVHPIFKDSGMKKKSARWVPRMLSVDQKRAFFGNFCFSRTMHHPTCPRLQ